MRPGVVVITYNSADVVGECVDACVGAGLDVMVVDNASSDGTAEVVSARTGVRVIVNATNRGFAAAANQGIGALQSDVVLVLNPDAIPNGNVDLLADTARERGVGAAAGRLTDEQGNTQHGFNVRRFPTPATLALEVLGINRFWPGNPVNRRYRQTIDTEGIVDVEQPAAAFLMVNRVAWQAVGGFDEAFHPVWFEDVDFCKRLHERGYRILYVPAVTARHVGGHSAAKLPWSSRQVFWYGSLVRYAAKHYRKWPCRLVCLAVMIASLGRMVHSVAVQASLKPVSVYSRVFWLAWSGCGTGERGKASVVNRM